MLIMLMNSTRGAVILVGTVFDISNCKIHKDWSYINPKTELLIIIAPL